MNVAASGGTPTPAHSGIDPMLVQSVENNLLLHQVVDDLKTVKEKQDNNHLIAVLLRDHQTIERVDQLWTSFASLQTLLRVIAGSLASIPLLAALFTISHFFIHWP